MIFSLIMYSLLISVFLAAFTKHLGTDYSFTLEHVAAIPIRGWSSIRNTLLFATITSVTMSLLGIISAYLITRVNIYGKEMLDFLITLPFAIPGTFMGVGYALAFNRPPLLLSGTWMIVVFVTVIRELPLGLRVGTSVLSQQDCALEDASANLGASRPTTFLRVILPMARPALLVSTLYAFVSTVETLGAIVFLITPSNKVLSADVFEYTVRGDVGVAAAFSMVMVVLAAMGMISILLIISHNTAKAWLLNLFVPRTSV